MKNHRRLRDTRQSENLREPLLSHLPGVHDIGTRFEVEPDPRQSRYRLGANFLNPGRAVEHVGFQRRGDHGLHFLRRETKRFGLNFHVWTRKLRQRVDWHFAQPPHA